MQKHTTQTCKLQIFQSIKCYTELTISYYLRKNWLCKFSDNEAEFNLDTHIENDETDEQFSISKTTTGVDDCGITDVEGSDNEWDICLSKSENCLTSSDSNMSKHDDKMTNDLGKSLGSKGAKRRRE